jgi:hypothetical protein
MSQSTEDNHEKMKDTERIKWVWISYIAETLAASNSAVDWQFTIKFTTPGYRPGRAASARRALVRLATSAQSWRRGGRGRPYGSSFRRTGSDVEMPAGVWMRRDMAVEIRSIENKKNSTVRTQSKLRCNLEDGSNEVMNETNP